MANKDLARRFHLNERQAAFLNLVLAGREPADAYLEAGYSGTRQSAVTSAATLLNHGAVAPALHLALGRRLATDAVLARSVAIKILQDDSVGAKIRADLAVKMLRLAGHVEPRAAIADNGPVKTLSEMSTEELRSRAEQLEEEIAARARPVSGQVFQQENLTASAAPVPLDPEAIEMFE